MVWPFDRERLGRRGERWAAWYLRRQGYTVLVRSYRCPIGEVDLIARQGDTLIFVEVKTRRSLAHGRPEEAVDQRKRRQITKAALHYLKGCKTTNVKIRFDIVAVQPPATLFGAPAIEHFPGAFDAEGPWSL